MHHAFHAGNRERLYAALKPATLLVLFSGEEIRKTNDEYWPFFTDRNFYYLTGLDSRDFALLALKGADGAVTERLYILPPDPLQERWTGRRITAEEARQLSGVNDVRFVSQFEGDLHALCAGGHYSAAASSVRHICLDLFRVSPRDIDRPAHKLLRRIQADYPYLQVENANAILRQLRLIKQPCEIAALRQAETVTREGILAMMKASRPGMYEYQYKAEFDHALAQHGPQGPGFPSIISAGRNNFCIHYYAYTGQAQEGDMILCDVGAQHDSLITDVSRAFPCGGRFNDRQRLLWNCALRTSDHMFSILRPGYPMAEVDAEIRRFCARQLMDAGVLDREENIGRYMWHGGSHHIGYDVHDVVARPETLAPGMVFCVDVGIYHEEWGIGFRLEDNCLITEDGCENLSASIPRTVEDIEAAMRGVSALQEKEQTCMNSITEPINTGDYEYIVLENGTVEITGYTGSARELILPAKLDGHVVSSLGAEAFGGCDGLTRITIPGSVVCIGKNPFTGCLILTDVLVAADHPTLETIDGVLFEKRTRTLLCCPCAFPQKHYAIPQGTKAIGDYAFEDCDALISVTIPDSVTSIGEYAFDGCESLTSVAIPDSVVSIGNHAFYHCLALTSVNIPDGVTIIGNDTFGSCASLPSVTIPDSVTSIGDYAFHSCNALTSITIPDGVTSIGDGAFKYCSSLPSITIPDSVTSIGDEAFNCCISLPSITIPDSVTHIGAGAFQDCSALTAITVGRDSFAAQYCKDNGLPFTFAEDVQP